MEPYSSLLSKREKTATIKKRVQSDMYTNSIIVYSVLLDL